MHMIKLVLEIPKNKVEAFLKAVSDGVFAHHGLVGATEIIDYENTETKDGTNPGTKDDRESPDGPDA